MIIYLNYYQSSNLKIKDDNYHTLVPIKKDSLKNNKNNYNKNNKNKK